MRTAAAIFGLRFKMKELTTPEEWKALTAEWLVIVVSIGTSTTIPAEF
jgi:hypothetical protein